MGAGILSNLLTRECRSWLRLNEQIQVLMAYTIVARFVCRLAMSTTEEEEEIQ